MMTLWDFGWTPPQFNRQELCELGCVPLAPGFDMDLVQLSGLSSDLRTPKPPGSWDQNDALSAHSARLLKNHIEFY